MTEQAKSKDQNYNPVRHRRQYNMECMREVTKTILQRTREPDTGENNQDNGSGRKKKQKAKSTSKQD